MAQVRLSMAMRVMRVRDVWMRMAQRFMTMNVAVRPLRHRLVSMIMMAVVVNMRVFVLHRPMLVLMAVRFGDVQKYASKH